jgi:small subunit ribosomal protein S8
MKDNISDMLTRIRNGQKAHLLEIPLFWPTPKVNLQILKILEQEGYIRGFKKEIFNEKLCIFVLLKYTEFQQPVIKKIERISKPGKRIFCKTKNFWKLNNGSGVLVISSPIGLITDSTARKLNLGGEILFYIE